MEAILESLFLKILNMSMTACYVIAAILIVRLLLRRAPRKYSYILWAAACFRLLCPVSFESIFSLFSLSGLRLNVESSSAGAAEIVHIPQDIGFMPRPQITTGIPAVNNVVNPMLPPATPYASVNPMQIWIFLGMVLWLAGIAALIMLSLISLIRLRRRLSTATRLEGNVWQSESVRSPFILGLFRPRIYIPYSLGEKELAYVLEHERSHIRRGDHIIKLLAFATLCLHWFNPLVWLSYYLMDRDMEQSCDERVLSKNPNIGTDYSQTLLSFAANRRLPLPTALAFGESGVRSRIKNALRWKKPRLWVSIAALLACIAVVVACAANPKDEPSGHALKDVEPVALSGTYVPWDCVHQHPAISYVSLAGNSGYRYLFEDGKLTIIDQALGKPAAEYELADAWQELPWTDEEWETMLMLPTDSHTPLSQQYMSVLYCPLDGQDQFLMLVDGQLWIVSSYAAGQGSRYIDLIYSLVPQEDMGYAQGHFNPTYSSQWGIPINFDIEDLDHVNILCDTGMVAFAGESGMEIKDFDHGDDKSMAAGDTLLWNPSNVQDDSPLLHSIGVIQFTALTDTKGISGTIYLELTDRDDGNGTYIYTIRVVGTGLYIEQDSSGRISITHSGEGAWSLLHGGEVGADSPWNWTSSLSLADIKGFSTDLEVEFGGGFDLESSLTAILNALPPDAFSTGRGYPGGNFVTIKTEDGSSFTLRQGPDFVELSIDGPAAELYGRDDGVWEIRSEELLAWFGGNLPLSTESPLSLLHGVRAEDIAYLSSKQGIDPGLLYWPAFTGQLLATLQSISPEEVYTEAGGGTAQAILTIHEEDGDSISLLYCDGVVELGFGGAYFDAYGNSGTLWKVKNESLNDLFRWAMQTCPEQSEEMLTGLDLGVHEATLYTYGGYFRLSPGEYNEIARLLDREATVVANPTQDAMTGDIMYILQVVFKDTTENYIFGTGEGDIFYRCTGSYDTHGYPAYVKIESPQLSEYLYSIASTYETATENHTALLLELLGSLEQNSTLVVDGAYSDYDWKEVSA